MRRRFPSAASCRCPRLILSLPVRMGHSSGSGVKLVEAGRVNAGSTMIRMVRASLFGAGRRRGDADQLDGEDQGGAARNRPAAVPAIGESSRDREFEPLADPHQRHALLPAADQPGQRESGGLPRATEESNSTPSMKRPT